MEAWTAQYRYTGPYRLDVTVKGQDPIGKLFAPTWDMVMKYKDSKQTEEDKKAYIQKYHAVILNVIKNHRKAWDELLARKYVVVVCFCKAGEFCHRHLLMHYLQQYGAVCNGEITDFSRWGNEQKVIKEFKGQYDWASNFAPCKIDFQNIVYESTEALYQAWKFSVDDTLKVQVETVVNGKKVVKTQEVNAREHIAKLSPGAAKRAGRKAKLCWNWDTVRVEVMRVALDLKYNQEPYKSYLLRTDNAIMIEGNYWHDNFWGDCSCPKCEHVKGINMLGKLTMEKRDALRAATN